MTSKQEEQALEQNPSVPDLPAANNKLAATASTIPSTP